VRLGTVVGGRGGGATPICGRAQAREWLVGRPLNMVSTQGRLPGRFRTGVQVHGRDGGLELEGVGEDGEAQQRQLRDVVGQR